MITNYNKIREFLADMEHQQWMVWSKNLSDDLKEWLSLLKVEKGFSFVRFTAIRKINDRLDRWKKNWKPYSELDEDIKDMDREWADKILDNVPFKCPVHQCGGIMRVDIIPYPEGKNEDDYTDGMAGDDQTPDLVCTNCGARYHLVGFNKE